MKVRMFTAAAMGGILVGSAAFIAFPRTPILLLIVLGILSALTGVVLYHFLQDSSWSRKIIGTPIFAHKIVPKQLQEHFLFNSLHQISLTILNDIDKASRCTEDLAHFLRLVLEMRKNEFVILSQELRCIDFYVKIEKERLGERLSVVRQVDPQCLEVRIPCFTILPLVENSILHGAEKSTETVTIFVLVQLVDEHVKIEVSDTGVEMNPAQLVEAMKTGPTLTSIKQRLRSLYGRTARMELEALAPSGLRVVLTVPRLI